jgi:hypothetical protein
MRPPNHHSPGDEEDPASGQDDGEGEADAGGEDAPLPPDYSTWSVKELKQALAKAGVNHSWANTKEDLVALARERRVRPAPGFGDDDIAPRVYSWEMPDSGAAVEEESEPQLEGIDPGEPSRMQVVAGQIAAEDGNEESLPELADSQPALADSTPTPDPAPAPSLASVDESPQAIPSAASLTVQGAAALPDRVHPVSNGAKTSGVAASDRPLSNTLRSAGSDPVLASTPVVSVSAFDAGKVNVFSSGDANLPAPFTLPSSYTSRTGSPVPLGVPPRTASPHTAEARRKPGPQGSKRGAGSATADAIQGAGNGADLVYGLSDAAKSKAVSSSIGGAKGAGSKGMASSDAGSEQAKNQAGPGSEPARPNGGSAPESSGTDAGAGERRRDAAVFQTVLSRRSSPGPRVAPDKAAAAVPPAEHGPGNAGGRGTPALETGAAAAGGREGAAEDSGGGQSAEGGAPASTVLVEHSLV